MSNKKKYILIGIGVLILISLLSSIGGGDSEVVEQKPIILKAAQTEISIIGILDRIILGGGWRLSHALQAGQHHP